jgi:hypothetical protein
MQCSKRSADAKLMMQAPHAVTHEQQLQPLFAAAAALY